MYREGQIVDDMQIISYEGKTKNWVKLYKVKCIICGNEKIIQYSRLNSHTTTKHNNRSCLYKVETDLHIGKKKNDYTIIKRLDRRYRTEHYYLAKCDVCGIEYETTIGNFNRGYGTYHKNCTDHIPVNKYLPRFRKIYSCMRYRTTNPKYSEWDLYGGRGINSEYYKDFMIFIQNYLIVMLST